VAANRRESSGKRPWIAVLLAVLYPGLGHLYLRLWGRAILWFVFVVTSTTLLVPDDVYPATFSVEAVVGAAQAIPLVVSLVVLALSALNVVDAYLMARRMDGGNDSGTDRMGLGAGTGGSDDGTQTCPSCGKELDEDLDFCHWCTTELDGTEQDR
jgi:hypothetical protein